MRHLKLRSRTLSGAAQSICLLLASHAVTLAQQYTISTVAGGAPPATPAAAASISIGPPQRVTADAAGNLYFTSLNCVFKVDAGGTLALIAGNSRSGFGGDGGPATQAKLSGPQGLAVDASNNIFIADTGNNRIREVTPDGKIQTVAGTGQPGFYGNEGPATLALLHTPTGVAVSSGNLYIADSANHQVRIVTPDGNIKPFAGNAFPGFFGDTFPAISANLNGPKDVAIGAKGLIYIADTNNARIRAVGTDGNINTVAGSSSLGFVGDGAAATSASLSQPYSVAADSAGNVYFVDFGNNRIRMVDTKGNISTVAGIGTPLGFAGDGAAASKATLNLPTGIAVDASGNISIADQWNFRIRKFTSTRNISTVAGNGVNSDSGDGGSATLAQLNGPQGTAVDTGGNLYITDSKNGVVRKVSANRTISTLGGTSLVFPRGIATDTAGNVYVADYLDNRVKRIALDGTVSTVAGNGNAGFAGDGGTATSAQLNGPFGVAVDRNGNLFIADFSNNLIRKVSAGGVITTVAGSARQGYSGDGAAAVQASLNGPFGVAVDVAGNLYIADTNNNVIREVTTDGVIHTIAGTGVAGYTGDGGPATQAEIVAPAGIAVDSAGNVYIADTSMRIRRISPGAAITTIGGVGLPGYAGDNGIATLAALNGPAGVALDQAGNVYVADTGNNAIRLLQPGSATSSLQAVTSAATNLPGPIAPGEVVVLYGSGLGPAQLTVAKAGAGGFIGTNLAGTSVYFNNIPAPILYTSPNQVGAVVPFGISGTNVSVFVTNQSQATAPKTVAMAQTVPGLFTVNYSGKGQAVALNQNQSQNSAATPAKVGTNVTLFATGLGQTTPPGTDGLLGSSPLPASGQPVTASIGGQTATVVAATGVLNQVSGIMQVTVQVPAGAQPGNAVPVTLQVGGVSAAGGATIAVSQ